MTILAVQNVPRTAGGAVRGGVADPVVEARQLSNEIKYHRAESRRLLLASQRHRAALVRLLGRRDLHAIELHRAGWPLAPIARIHKLTRERVRQIVASTSAPSTSADDMGVTP